MKRQLLFVQGAGAGVHDEWDNKLVESLSSELGVQYEIFYPRMPSEDNPSAVKWKVALRKQFAELRDGAIAVAHSVGGTILINAIAEQKLEIVFGAIVLISAPFVGEGGWPNDDWQSTSDLGERLPRDVPIYIFHGLADSTVPPAHVELYAQAIPQAHVLLLPGRNHQLNDDLRDIAEIIKALE